MEAILYRIKQIKDSINKLNEILMVSNDPKQIENCKLGIEYYERQLTFNEEWYENAQDTKS